MTLVLASIIPPRVRESFSTDGRFTLYSADVAAFYDDVFQVPHAADIHTITVVRDLSLA